MFTIGKKNSDEVERRRDPSRLVHHFLTVALRPRQEEARRDGAQIPEGEVDDERGRVTMEQLFYSH